MTHARFFVTGTDTGVGKTQVGVALLRAMVEAGLTPFAFKPYESGGPLVGSDSEQLREAAGGHQRPGAVCLYRLKAPLAPMMAARLERRRTSFAAVVRAFGRFEGPGVVEGAGGLHVPLDAHHDVVDLIEALRVPVLVVARAGLGTVNHTTLTLEALGARACQVAGVVLQRTVAGADRAVALNRAELERRFPRIPFAGPVPFEPARERRLRLVGRALAELPMVRALR